jgi:hypothetical protein
MLFDPIFQGLAISLMAGEVASLLLSRMAVPILFFMEETGVTRYLKGHGRKGKGEVPPPEGAGGVGAATGAEREGDGPGGREEGSVDGRE